MNIYVIYLASTLWQIIMLSTTYIVSFNFICSCPENIATAVLYPKQPFLQLGSFYQLGISLYLTEFHIV